MKSRAFNFIKKLQKNEENQEDNRVLVIKLKKKNMQWLVKINIILLNS